MTQDRIAESGMDRPSDMDFNSWFKAAQCLDLNRLTNEAFHYASRHYPTHSAPLRTLFSFLHSQAPPTTTTPAAIHTSLCALPPGILIDVDCTQTLNLSHKPATDVARLVTLAENATFVMMSAI
jgi:hypothetical protein